MACDPLYTVWCDLCQEHTGDLIDHTCATAKGSRAHAAAHGWLRLRDDRAHLVDVCPTCAGNLAPGKSARPYVPVCPGGPRHRDRGRR